MARKTTGANDVAQLASLLRQGGRGRGRRSPLARWLRIHHDAFAALLDEQEPGWADVATALAAMGVCDGDGKPPTGERTRKAWWGVRRDVAQRRATKAPVPPTGVPASLAVPPGLPPAPQSPEIMPALQVTPAEVARPKLVLDIRPAIPLGSQVPAAGAAVAVTPPATGPVGTTDPAPVDVQAELRRLQERMQAGKVPVPKIVD
jgi:hypothetical protein